MEYFRGYVYDNFITLILLVGLMVMLVPKTPFPQNTKKMVYALVIGMLTISFVDYYEWHLSKLTDVTYHEILMRVLFSDLGYILRPLMIIVPIGVLARQRTLFKAMCSLEVINIIIYTLNWFVPIAFWYTDENGFDRGPLGYYPHIISTIYMIYLVAVLFDRFGRDKKNSIMVYFICFVLFVSMTIVTLANQSLNVKILDPTISVVIVFCYSYLQIQSMHDYDQLQRQALDNAKDALLVSQIQPHFLYNTMNTIYYLCKVDPDLAAKTVDNFSRYLRGNMEMGKNPDMMIPFQDDIAHTKAYSDIEMLRFENITIEYDLEDTNFKIPAITVQPMVENAVKHGVRNKENGLIIVQSRGTDTDHIIKIIDNGIGCVRESKSHTEMNHTGMGIPNVRKRIEAMTGGTFDIQMVKDQGTTVTITIPRYPLNLEEPIF